MISIKKLLPSVALTLITLCWGSTSFAAQKPTYDSADRLAQKIAQNKIRKDAAKRLKVAFQKAHAEYIHHGQNSKGG